MRNFAQIKTLINQAKGKVPLTESSKSLPDRIGREIYRFGVKFSMATAETKPNVQAALTILNAALSLAAQGQDSQAVRLMTLARKLGTESSTA